MTAKLSRLALQPPKVILDDALPGLALPTRRSRAQCGAVARFLKLGEVTGGKNYPVGGNRWN
jgi:hypothetical protein